MDRLVFVGSHLGYAMDRTPLGGGAMVGLQLARAWSREPGVRLTVLGSGELLPAAGLDYVRLPPTGAPTEDLTALSELQYARFCRRFENATTQWLLENVPAVEAARTAVVVNDISEAPDLGALSRAGFPIVSLWHVDVVDYFNRLYLKDFLRVESLTRFHDRLHRLGSARLLPDLLKLVFEKQRQTVLRSRRMIFPSQAMADTIARCYDPDDFGRRGIVVPWGVWPDQTDDASVEFESARLRRHYQISPQTTVLMTLSRISPEKGIHLLLEAIGLLEKKSSTRQDLCLFICGEPAFMRGESYFRRVRRAAAKLKKARIFFPGYLAEAEKQAYYRLAALFVSPSIHDSYGLNIVEAMQAGLPVLASEHYGVRDILKDSFGRSVSYESLARAPRQLAAALEDLLSDRRRLERMGAQAKRAAQEMPFSRAASAVLSCAREACGKARETVASK